MEQATAKSYAAGYEGFQIPWWLVVLEGIFDIIIGVFLLSSPVETTIMLLQILGIFWILAGILSIVSLLVDRENSGWKILIGLAGILIGALVFIYPFIPFVILALLVIILGMGSILYGVIRLVWAFKGGGIGMAALGLLTIVVGVLLLINPLAGAVVLPWIYGFFLVAGGVAALIGGFRMRSGKSLS